MSDIDEVLARLTRDRTFRAALEQDPQAALAGYELTADDLRRLADHLAADADGPVERRTSRSALFALLAGRTRERDSRPETADRRADRRE